jgi:site-specific DNA-methyltransferase (cytosine-N4-specific)
MPTMDRPILRLPYSQQFSPAQTPLNKLLAVLRSNAGKPSLTRAIASAFFRAKAAPEKLAGNTVAALRSYDILDEDNRLAAFGTEILTYQGREQDAHRLLAKRLLLDFNGVALIETLREMEEGRHKIDLPSLTAELQQRGFALTTNSSDLSSVLGWLRAAGVMKVYGVNTETYRQLVGASVETLNAFRGLIPEQVAFLRAMLALNIRDWTPYNSIVRHAETLYAGEVRYNWKEIVSTILQPLQRAGLIEIRKRTKADRSTPAGRGGKTADVMPTGTFDTEVADPLLQTMFKGAGQVDIRRIRRTSLQDIVAAIKQSEDPNKRGKALEMLAIRLCQMLDLEFMGWRETDVEVVAGGEADAMMHSARLIYSRWQVQCKVGQISYEAVAKEVGMQHVTLSNVILVVSTGKATDSAQEFRRRIVSTGNLNIIFLDGAALQRIIADHSTIVEVLRQQAREALSLKPTSGLRHRQDDKAAKADETSNVVAEDSPEYGGPNSVATSLPKPAYSTDLGSMYCGDALTILPELVRRGFRARLIITSPPFALVRKKEYGNEDSDTYIEWFAQFIPHLKRFLEPQGSLVIDIGGTWIKGLPAKSTYQFKLLLRLCESGFFLAQDFYHFNPARLPTPAEWVTVRRLRVKDAINNVWWLALDPFVDADNRRVLLPYSDSMRTLIEKGYKPALRPSGHDISDKFGKDNGGSIPPNLLQFANTDSNSHYLRRCKEKGLKPHPARFPSDLPEFFIKYLTQPGDLVYDPFAGSNVTGATAEATGRRWIATEISPSYVEASTFRFEPGARRQSEKKGKARTPNRPAVGRELQLF